MPKISGSRNGARSLGMVSGGYEEMRIQASEGGSVPSWRIRISDAPGESGSGGGGEGTDWDSAGMRASGFVGRAGGMLIRGSPSLVLIGRGEGWDEVGRVGGRLEGCEWVGPVVRVDTLVSALTKVFLESRDLRSEAKDDGPSSRTRDASRGVGSTRVGVGVGVGMGVGVGEGVG